MFMLSPISLGARMGRLFLPEAAAELYLCYYDVSIGYNSAVGHPIAAKGALSNTSTAKHVRMSDISCSAIALHLEVNFQSKPFA